MCGFHPSMHQTFAATFPVTFPRDDRLLLTRSGLLDEGTENLVNSGDAYGKDAGIGMAEFEDQENRAGHRHRAQRLGRNRYRVEVGEEAEAEEQ